METRGVDDFGLKVSYFSFSVIKNRFQAARKFHVRFLHYHHFDLIINIVHMQQFQATIRFSVWEVYFEPSISASTHKYTFGFSTAILTSSPRLIELLLKSEKPSKFSKSANK